MFQHFFANFPGLVGILWFFSWTCLVFDTPAQHPRISQREREYIEKSLHGMMPKHLEVNIRTYNKHTHTQSYLSLITFTTSLKVFKHS